MANVQETFFAVLAESLASARVPARATTGCVLFEVGTLKPRFWRVELGHKACRVTEQATAAAATLHVYCDEAQLEALLKGKAAAPLRYAGDVALWDGLVNASRPPQGTLALRAALSR
jgi:hypothetical protein